MIRVGAPVLFLGPLVFGIAAMAVMALYYSFSRGSKRRDTSRSSVYRCAVCRHVYADVRQVPLSRCPRCGHMNQTVRR